MEESSEMRNFAMVWTAVPASLIYCHIAGNTVKPGLSRLITVLPIISLFLILPLSLRTIFLGGPTSFFVAWLATFKLILFSLGQGPLSEPLSASHFVAVSCFPISMNSTKEITNRKNKSAMNYITKALALATVVPAYLNKSRIDPRVFLFLYGVYTYTALEIILAGAAAGVRAGLGADLETQFDEPFMAKSLQDFWGRRWNLAAVGVLRPTVYVPVRGLAARFVGRRWAPLLGVVATFLVSGLMHEMVLYTFGRVKPDGRVTAFFALHGVCLAAEILAKKAAAKRGFKGVPGPVYGPLAVGFVVATGIWLFLPALMRCEADVMAHREMVAVLEFAKGLASRLNLDQAFAFSLSNFQNMI